MDKRRSEMSPQQVQRGNRAWWTRNTMSYDWKDKAPGERFSLAWYDDIDTRFIHGARLFATDKTPFDRIIPFDQLHGKMVLEIGCGMGLHTELMIRAGADVTSIDLSDTSVEATRTRLQLKGLQGNVLQGDAEQLPFPDKSFDFVWSWGVIHHSSRTALIVRQIARVLRPGGSCRVMVYNREGIGVKVAFWTQYLLRGGALRWTFEEFLYRTTDGYSARYYVPEQFEDLFRAFFTDVSSQIMGMEADAVPLPRHPRRLVLPLFSERRLRRGQATRGAFIFLTAQNPFKLAAAPAAGGQ